MSQSPPFVPRLELAQRLHDEAVGPLLERYAPELLRVPPNLDGVGQVIASTDALENVDRHHTPRRWIGSGGS
jgi:hypothetical protein